MFKDLCERGGGPVIDATIHWLEVVLLNWNGSGDKPHVMLWVDKRAWPGPSGWECRIVCKSQAALHSPP